MYQRQQRDLPTALLHPLFSVLGDTHSYSADCFWSFSLSILKKVLLSLPGWPETMNSGCPGVINFLPQTLSICHYAKLPQCSHAHFSSDSPSDLHFLIGYSSQVWVSLIYMRGQFQVLYRASCWQYILNNMDKYKETTN